MISTVLESVNGDVTRPAVISLKNHCANNELTIVVKPEDTIMDSEKQDECKKAKSPFLRPVVLFCKKRQEFLREKSKHLQPEPEEKSGLPNYMKSTQMSRVKTCPRAVIHDIVPEEDESDFTRPTKAAPVPNSGCLQKLSLSDYLEEQREKVYTKYAHAIKRDINEKLKKDIEMELEEITRAEKHVEEEEIVFQKLIEEREEKLSNALQLSEKFAKLKTEVTEEYEKRTAEIRKLKSDIESFREKLREYTQYKDFLTGLAPATWREQQTQKKEQRRIAKLESLKNAGTDQSQKEKKKRKHSTKPKKPPQKQHKKGSKKSGQDTCPKVEFSDSDEEPEIYFTDPMDVMTALDELMEEDLFHIQDFQDTEEDMTRIHKVLQQTKTETTTLMQQGNENIETLKANIKTAEEIASDLELKSRLFSYGEYSVNQDKMIKSLHEKVKKVYEKCVDDVDTSTLSMLTSMEHKVEEIMQLIEELPPGMFDAIERTRETERRQKMLLEKQILERQMRMERQKRAAERAAADIKRITTRKLVYRSQPPKLKKKDSSRQLSMVTKEQLEAEYYFS